MTARTRSGWRWALPAALLIVAPAPAQILDLDGVPDPPETPISVLDEIATRMTTDLPAIVLDTDAGIVQAAGTTLRRVVAELASRGRGDDPGDAAAALAALRLAPAIDGLVARLDRLAMPGAFTGSPPRRLEEESRRRAIARLKTFARSGLEELRRRTTDELVDSDDAISLVLAPVVDAIEILERRPLVDRWPDAHEVRTAGMAPAPVAFPPLPDRPGLPVADRGLREDATTEGRRIHRRFREAAARAVALDPDGPATPVVLDLLDDVPNHRDPQARRRAVAVLDLASRIAVDLDRIAATPARRDADPDQLAGLLAAAVAADDDRGLRLLERQKMVTALIAAGGTIDLEVLDRDLRSAGRAVQRRHRRLVRSTVETLARIGSDPSALGDPAAVAALQGLEGSIADLERLRLADGLSARMTAIRPGAVREFERRIRGWCLMLGKDATRTEGASAIDGITRDLDLVMPFPAEAWLVTGGPAVVERTGGRGRDFLDRATETRRRWADEVSNGELDGPARAELLRFARLGTLLEAVEAVLGADDEEVARGLDACDRWGGWFVMPERMGWTARTLAPSLRVAVAAAADGVTDRLDRDLVRLEAAAPPAMVVHWIARHVGPLLDPLAAGSIGGLAAAALPPGDDPWAGDHRERLARICRGFAEIDAARTRGDEDLARRLTDWTVQACDDLLDRVRLETATTPTSTRTDS